MTVADVSQWFDSPAVMSWCKSFSLVFVGLFIQALPFLLLGSVTGVLVSVFVPLERLTRYFGKSPLIASALSATAGFIVPSCECVAVPVVRRLVLAGCPSGAAVAYLLSSPGLNPICLISTYSAFYVNHPWEMVILRAAGAWVLAVVAGWAIHFFAKNSLWKDDLVTVISPRVQQRQIPGVGRVFAAVIEDFTRVGGLYMAGCACAALIQTLPTGWQVLPSTGLSGIFSLMVMAFVMSLCSTVDAFVANSFGGFSLAAKLAFLWLGPVLDLKLLVVYYFAFRARTILLLVFVLGAGVFLLSWILLLSGYGN